MERINYFTILSVTVEGFKCFQERQIFEFENTTFLTGANGLGKSSIADAIAFAFTGTNFFGEKYLDKLHHPECPELSVCLKIADDIGEVHNLVRVHKNSVSAISYDSYNIRQKDIEMIFGEGDLFLSLFNPLYFVETLGTSGKTLLENLLPFVSHEAVLAALSDTIRSQMLNENILAPETYIKNRREEIQEQQENLIYLQGQADLQDTEKKNAQESIKQTQEAISVIKKQIDELESEKKQADKEQEDIRLAQLSQHLNELLINKNKENPTNKLIEQTHEIKIKLAMMNEQSYQSSYTEILAQKQASLNILYSEYGEVEAIMKSIKPGYQCPTCFHQISENNLQKTKGELQRKLTECIANGKKIKNDFMQTKEYEKIDKQKILDQNKADIQALEETLSDLNTRFESAKENSIISEKKWNEDIDKTRAEIKDIEYHKENGNLTPKQLHKIDELKQELHDLEIKLNIFLSVLDKPDVMKELNNTQQKITELKILINNAILYVGKKNELIFKDLHMNKVKILLYEVIKSTSEIKDTFKVAYDGREYKRLSLSEKVRAGLEITELLKKLSHRNYPTFIDNSESICVIDNVRPSSQLIFSRAEKGKPLAVTYKNSPLRKVG